MERIGLTPGSEIGGYTVVAPLGSGGMGTVYRAVDGGGHAVALKLLHPHVGSDAAVRSRLMREVAALQRLRHPAVAAVLDAEADSTEAFLVTELVAGDTLTEHVRAHGPLDADALAGLAEGLRSALAAVHAAGVVHRDLKPSNVLVTDDGPVLIDFGLAQGVDDDANLTTAGFVLGTPGYLAPELLDGGDPSPATDLWGWAAVLAFAATGRDPFGSRPVEAVLARARSGEVDLDGVGPATADAIRAVLRPDPDDRADPDTAVATLRSVADDGEPSADAVGTVALATGAAAGTAATGAGPDDDAGAGDASDDEVAPDHDADVDDAGAEGDDDLDGEGLDHDASDDEDEDPDDEDVDGEVDEDLDDEDADDRDADDEDLDDEDELATELVARPSPQDAMRTVAVATAATVAPPDPPVRDGSTVAVPVRPPAPAAVAPAAAVDPDPVREPVEVVVEPEDPADGTDWLDEDGEVEGEAWDDPGYERPPARRRWGSMLAIGLVVLLGGMVAPVLTVGVVLVLVVVMRTVGLTVESMHARRERRGVRRGDVPLAVVGVPWYLVRGVLGTLPAVLVGGAAVLIVGGLGWWLLEQGHWAIGGSPGGEPPQGWTARLLLGGLVALAVGFLWWGPLSRMARTGARRTLAVVAPGPVGALVVVVLALVAALLLFDRLVDQVPVAWWPLDPPDLPAP